MGTDNRRKESTRERVEELKDLVLDDLIQRFKDGEAKSTDVTNAVKFINTIDLSKYEDDEREAKLKEDLALLNLPFPGDDEETSDEAENSEEVTVK